MVAWGSSTTCTTADYRDISIICGPAVVSYRITTAGTDTSCTAVTIRERYAIIEQQSDCNWPLVEPRPARRSTSPAHAVWPAPRPRALARWRSSAHPAAVRPRPPRADQRWVSALRSFT
jgi:hypothetical protein